ncbi:hypothetical protein TNCV_4173641 [Trichonephila clavipes]|nr:hypothetical protein TNCV_4173641 [Trichonephila clavipes]
MPSARQMFEVTTRSRLEGLIVVLHGIPLVLEDFWHVAYHSGSYRDSNDEVFISKKRYLVYQKERVNSLKNQPPVLFCLHLQRSRDLEHACSDNVPGTTTEQRACYNLHIYTLPTCRSVSSFDYQIIQLRNHRERDRKGRLSAGYMFTKPTV